MNLEKIENLKIALINISGIGDVISSLSVGEKLARNNKVTYVIPKSYQGIFSKSDFKEVYSNEIIKEKFDIIIDLTSNKDSRKIIKNLSGKFKIGRYKNTFQRIKYNFIYNKMVNKFTIDDNIVMDYKPILDFLKIDFSNVINLPIKKEIIKEEIIIHIGADKKIRRIPINLIIQICEYAKVRSISIRLIGTEEDLANEVLEKTNDYPIYEKGGLKEVKHWINTSKLVIAPDSGIFHLASALGKQSIGLYGPNTSHKAGVKSTNSRYVELDYNCRPCNQNNTCPYNNKCMNDIPFESLKKHIDEAFN